MDVLKSNTGPIFLKRKFLQEYEAKCQKFEVKTHPTIVEMFNMENFNQKILNLRGNQKTLFNNRINDHQVRCILDSLLAAEVNVAYIDLSLNHITDEGNRLTDEGIRQLCSCLNKNFFLEAIDISDNEITDKGALYITDMLGTNSTLRYFNLSKSNIKITGGIALFLQVMNHPSLLAFNFASSLVKSLNLEYVNALSKLFKLNSILKEIDVSNTKLGDTGITRIIKYGLEHNNYLEKIVLRGNFISVDGAITFAKFLEKNQSIKEVDLRCNRIQTVGGNSMMEMLKRNNTLEKLDISYNHIGDVTLFNMANVFLDGENVVLKKLELLGNKFEQRSKKQFFMLIKERKSTVEFDFIPYRNEDNEKKMVYFIAEGHVEVKKRVMVVLDKIDMYKKKISALLLQMNQHHFMDEVTKNGENVKVEGEIVITEKEELEEEDEYEEEGEEEVEVEERDDSLNVDVGVSVEKSVEEKDMRLGLSLIKDENERSKKRLLEGLEREPGEEKTEEEKAMEMEEDLDAKIEKELELAMMREKKEDVDEDDEFVRTSSDIQLNNPPEMFKDFEEKEGEFRDFEENEEDMEEEDEMRKESTEGIVDLLV